MTDHECEWRLTVGHSNCKACHYSAIEGVACCEVCNESIGPTGIEAMLNEHAKLKRVRDAAQVVVTRLELIQKSGPFGRSPKWTQDLIDALADTEE